MTVIDQDFPCNHPSTSARNHTAVPKTPHPPSYSRSHSCSPEQNSEIVPKQRENVAGLTIDEDIGGGVDRSVFGADAAVRSRVLDTQRCDAQPAAGCVRVISGIAPLHLHPGRRERPILVRECPVQLAATSDGRSRAAVL